MIAIPTSIVKRVPYVGPVFSGVGLALDVKEIVEDASHIPFLPLDFVLFGQPVPANKDGRFSSWSNITDIVDNLTAIDDS